MVYKKKLYLNELFILLRRYWIILYDLCVIFRKIKHDFTYFEDFLNSEGPFWEDKSILECLGSLLGRLGGVLERLGGVLERFKRNNESAVARFAALLWAGGPPILSASVCA